MRNNIKEWDGSIIYEPNLSNEIWTTLKSSKDLEKYCEKNNLNTEDIKKELLVLLSDQLKLPLKKIDCNPMVYSRESLDRMLVELPKQETMRIITGLSHKTTN